LRRAAHAPIVLEQQPIPNPLSALHDRHRLSKPAAHSDGDGRDGPHRRGYARAVGGGRDRGRRALKENAMLIARRLAELGIVLPPVAAPGANYVSAALSANLLFLAGRGPYKPYGGLHTGIVGQDVSVEKAYQHARLTGLQLIATMQAELGDLDRVVRVVKVLGMVNAVAGFGQQPEVINGCSDLFIEVFGDRGRHARSAVGMGSLPGNITVEIEAIVEVS
jgi:enamine deaminase RidA (YjgF/YER057c/UK114 family)